MTDLQAFTDLTDDAALLSLEHQVHLTDVVGEHNWQVDLSNPVGGGTRAAFLIEHPDFELPAPEPARVMRILQQGLAELVMHNHRRAVYSYAVRRGLSAAFTDDRTRLTITGLRFTADVRFDDLGRIHDISASFG